MPVTYDSIASVVLGATSNTIDFGAIPSTFTDLRLIVVAKTTANNTTSLFNRIRFNGDSGANYSNVYAFSTNSGSQGSTSLNNLSGINAGFATPQESGAWGVAIIDIFSYRQAIDKTILTDSNSMMSGTGQKLFVCGTWRSSSPITDIELYSGASNPYAIGSMATLYGILRA